MILDDLFNLAAGDFVQGKFDVTIQATVTTNNTDGLQTTTNTAIAHPALILSYTPRTEVNVGGFPQTLPASFQGGELIITAPRFFSLHGADTYLVQWNDNAFTANVDGTTNIVYGAAGQQFVTISLCHYLRFGVTQ